MTEIATKLNGQERADFTWKYPSKEFHFKKFENSAARDQLKKLLVEAMNKRIWMQPIKSEE